MILNYDHITILSKQNEVIITTFGTHTVVVYF